MTQTPIFQSFTGGRGMRLPAPDVARGFMLLLIALANVPWWMAGIASLPDNLSLADQVWLLLRSGFVDMRSYPLFAALFGFGLMTMVNRRVTGDIERGVPPYWAVDSARRLIRRRGWWMLLFGAVHAVIFPGDIIGAYGLLAVIFAGWFVGKKYRNMAILAAIITAGALAFAWLGSLVLNFAEAWSGKDVMTSATGGMETFLEFGFFAPLLGVLGWVMSTPLTLATSLVVPAAFIGARLADTDILVNIPAYRSQLAAGAAAGLGFGFLGSLPAGLHISGFADGVAPAWSEPLTMLAGLAGAFGWLALLALYAGPPPASGALKGMRRPLAAMGQRSMTAYVAQSVLFLVLFGAAHLAGVAEAIGPALAAVVAVAVWLVTLAYCQWLAERGKRGPLEILLRRAVSRGENQYLAPLPQQFGPAPEC